MSDKKSGGNANIGTSSLILIFIVLCLTIFGLLSLSSAGSEWNLAKKNMESVKGYYEADSMAVEFAAMVEEALSQCGADASDAQYAQFVREHLGEFYREDENTVETDVEMPYGQRLHVTLALDRRENAGYQILTWNVYHSEDYEIDRSMPVWTGGQ